MRILPVLDLLNGTVVRGVAGRRDQYRPIVSRLCNGSDPLRIARAFRDQLGLTTLYVADLDAILFARPNRELYRTLSNEGFRLMIDAGLRDITSAEDLLASGADTAVIGLETWPGPEPLAALCCRAGSERLVFSLDLQSGSPLGNVACWNTADPFTIAARVIESGIRQLIVLDLAQVGVAAGLSTLPLCRRLRERFPEISLITGGGVRNADDLAAMHSLGIHGVLIASALHDGRITSATLQALDVLVTGQPTR